MPNFAQSSLDQLNRGWNQQYGGGAPATAFTRPGTNVEYIAQPGLPTYAQSYNPLIGPSGPTQSIPSGTTLADMAALAAANARQPQPVAGGATLPGTPGSVTGAGTTFPMIPGARVGTMPMANMMAPNPEVGQPLGNADSAELLNPFGVQNQPVQVQSPQPVRMDTSRAPWQPSNQTPLIVVPPQQQAQPFGLPAQIGPYRTGPPVTLDPSQMSLEPYAHPSPVTTPERYQLPYNPEVGQVLSGNDGASSTGTPGLLSWLQNFFSNLSGQGANNAAAQSQGASGGGYYTPPGQGGFVGASPSPGMSGYMYPNQQAATAAGDVGTGVTDGGAGGGAGGFGSAIGGAISNIGKNWKEPTFTYQQPNIPLPQRAQFAPPSLIPRQQVSF